MSEGCRKEGAVDEQDGEGCGGHRFFAEGPEIGGKDGEGEPSIAVCSGIGLGFEKKENGEKIKEGLDGFGPLDDVGDSIGLEGMERPDQGCPEGETKSGCFW